jgi:hypothetical protein
VVKTAEKQQVLRQSVSAADRSLELANTLYQEGYADFQRVLDAQQASFAQAESKLVNQGRHVAAVIALYKALGGGWLDMPVQQLIPEDVRATMQERSDWGSLLDAPLPTGPPRPPTTSETPQDE